MKVFSFQDLHVWQSSKDLCVQITKALVWCRDFWFLNQISRSSLSVPSNIAEGFERKWKAEFLQFLHIAKWSTAEMQTQIIIGQELWYSSPEQAEVLLRNQRRWGGCSCHWLPKRHHRVKESHNHLFILSSVYLFILILCPQLLSGSHSSSYFSS